MCYENFALTGPLPQRVPRLELLQILSPEQQEQVLVDSPPPPACLAMLQEPVVTGITKEKAVCVCVCGGWGEGAICSDMNN